jgi:hypothetical protein
MTIVGAILSPTFLIVEGMARPIESTCALRELKAVSIHAFW